MEYVAVAVLVVAFLYWRARRPRNPLDSLSPIDRQTRARYFAPREPLE
jgi:hypothetical protein